MTTSPSSIELPQIDIDATIERLAELVVVHAANVQRGQTVAIGSELGKEQLTRAVAAAAYRAGAGYVDVSYADPHVTRARIANADPDTLEDFPDWYRARMLAIGEARCATIAFSGATEPHLLDDLDPALVGREQHAPRVEGMQVINARSTNWTVAPCPTPGWAALVHPELDPDAALQLLWREVAYVCRLDTDDPVAAWNERMRQLGLAAGLLNERRFDSIRLQGPGTDLTVGLLPASTWIYAEGTTAWGNRHMPNLPSEEVFTTPDPTRTNGVVRATKPLFTSGAVIEDLEVEFRDGRVIRIDASKNADVLRAQVAKDEGAARLGELALVDGDGRIGATGTVFYDTLLDENAASHIALGAGYGIAAGEDAERANQSSIHIDFMIGSSDVRVTGMDAAGAEHDVLVQGAWAL
ncbi:MAG: peptidase aminopeptidase [Thermoleophilia bacterium]|nr:peptidase aminopeptidase [Thermoleophilia bacterium]